MFQKALAMPPATRVRINTYQTRLSCEGLEAVRISTYIFVIFYEANLKLHKIILLFSL